MSYTHHTIDEPQQRRPRLAQRFITLMLGALLVLTACGGVNESDARTETTPADGSTGDAVLFEEPRGPGADPFTATVVTKEADVVALAAADERVEIGPGLYGGTGDQQVCDRDLLAASLEAQPDKASAWADAVGIAETGIAEFIGELTPALLADDTRVTNHGFRDGRATAFQSVLGAGTAVLVDRDGKPLTRCACGNPLADPVESSTPKDDDGLEPPSGQTDPQAPDTGADGELDDAGAPPVVPSFCAVLANVQPNMAGGPTSPGPEALAAYLAAVSGGLDELIASAHGTPGFPVGGLADLIAYNEFIEDAIEVGGVPGPGDIELRDRVEVFLTNFCEEPSTEIPGTTDDGADDESTTANCGSMQFLLLTVAADGLGLDHAAVSAPMLAAMEAVLAGADPGEEFDVGDLSPLIAYENIGCQGAQAMQQLFEDNGMGHLIEGTDLGA